MRPSFSALVDVMLSLMFGPLHLHSCIVCGRRYDCGGLDCDEIEDGEPVCGPCAEKRFDEIVPQEKV